MAVIFPECCGMLLFAKMWIQNFSYFMCSLKNARLFSCALSPNS
jgi:hypothetical protein